MCRSAFTMRRQIRCSSGIRRIPDGNRSWIPLRYVYDALKTVSQYQYLLVQDYAEEQNQWMHDGITDAWGGM